MFEFLGGGQITWRADSNSLPTRAFPCRCITPFVSCGGAGGEHGVTRCPGSAALSINGVIFSTYLIATLLSRCRSRCWDFFILAGNCYFMYQRHLGAFLRASSKARMGALALQFGRYQWSSVSVSVSLRQRRGEDVPPHATIGRFAAIVFVLHGPYKNMWHRFRFVFITFCSLLGLIPSSENRLKLPNAQEVNLLRAWKSIPVEVSKIVGPLHSV